MSGEFASRLAEDFSPFTISVSDEQLADLRQRLAMTRWPEVDDRGWEYGAKIPVLKEFQEYWLNHYDWRRHEAALNRYQQFTARIDGLDIHFFYVTSKSQSRNPLLLLHGWPGSQVEFLDLIGPLTDPAAHGFGDGPGFDLVIPAIPGFGFGGKPQSAGWGPDRIADAFNALMRQLGYDRYGVQGGDWGAIIGRRMAQRHAAEVVRLHLNMPYAAPPEGADVPEEWIAFHARETAYLALQSTKPDAISLGQSDSPMGLATWILDKFAAWSDCGDDLLASIPIDTLITNIMFYWLTNSAASAARIYAEAAREGIPPFGGEPVSVPTAFAVFAGEPYQAPREWVERNYTSIARWNAYPRGGHFATLERREDMLQEILTYF